MTDKGAVDNRRCVFGYKKGPGLPVEIIPPAIPRIPWASGFIEKIQEAGYDRQVVGMPFDPVSFGVSPQKQPQRFRVSAYRYAQDGPQVDGELFERLYKKDAEDFRIERQGPENGTVQGVIRIVPFKIVVLDILFEFINM